MDGTCLVAKRPNKYLHTQRGYAPVEPFEHTISPQSPCDVGIKEGAFLGFGGKIVPAFEPHPKLEK
jgi:hypothetical protein